MTILKQQVDPYMLAAQFLVDRHLVSSRSIDGKRYSLRWWRDEYYLYERGTYRRLPDGELKAQLAGYLHSADVLVSSHVVNAVLLCLHHIAAIDGQVELNSWLDAANGAEVVVAANGNVSLTDPDPNTGMPRLLPHTSMYFSMARLPYEYHPDADCTRWKTFVADVMQDDEEYMLLLQQWAGYLFRRDLREHRFLLMTGTGSNGKGVFSEVIESLVGSLCCSHVPLSRFAHPFSLYSTLGKRVNITNETIHIIEEQAEAILKAFVAGDVMTFERKFKSPVDAAPTAKVMIATNAAPRFTDKTYGLWRRLLLIPFNRTIPPERQNRNLADELKEELPGILNWALAGLRSIEEQGGFAIPKAHRQLLEEYRRDSDPARAFLAENYQAAPQGQVVAAEVYSAYSKWCTVNGCKAMNARTFGQHIRRIFPDVTRERPGSGNSRRWIYRGISGVTSHASQGIPI